jgi:hypothetical protein
MPKIKPTFEQVKIQMVELKQQDKELDGTTLESTEEESIILRWGPYSKTMTQDEFINLTEN